MANQGRRRHYRFQAGSGEGLTAEVGPSEPGSKGLRRCALLNTSAGGIGIELDTVTARWAEIDLPALIRFSVRGSREKLLAEARIVRSEVSPDDEKRTRLGLSFVDARRLFAQLDDGTWKYFDRRRAERIAFGSGVEVPAPELRLVGPGISLRCAAEDLSLHGLCAGVAQREAEQLDDQPRLRLEVRIPDREPLRYDAQVRHLTPFGLTTRVGLSFEDGPDGPASRSEGTLARMLLGMQLRISVP